jgi:hypothetical protein
VETTVHMRTGLVVSVSSPYRRFGLGSPDGMLSLFDQNTYKSSSSRNNRASQHTFDDGRILLSSINREKSFVTGRKVEEV